MAKLRYRLRLEAGQKKARENIAAYAIYTTIEAVSSHEGIILPTVASSTLAKAAEVSARTADIQLALSTDDTSAKNAFGVCRRASYAQSIPERSVNPSEQSDDMGRTFENRKNAMAKRGLRDARAFTRAGRLIAMAVKAGGPDPEGNPALRRAVQNARSVNMPKDKIQSAIEKASGNTDTADYQEVIYEGYGPHGVPILVVTATDNTTRTFPNVRTAFNKGGGSMGNSGSVAFLFDQLAVFTLRAEGLDQDELELELIDHGLEELHQGTTEDDEPTFVLLCARDEFGNMQTALESKGIEPVSSGIQWLAKAEAELTDAQIEEVQALVDRIADDDDVQEVFTSLPRG